ncbi:MAG TPA: hypothetical protein VMI35_09945 [Puia sp.]|nr:hypothetical protein [Puia sp.]
MSKYLLLRSNKQTGPFTLDEMQAMGLKAYDLVWIEGKSAAWRYPCEIDELKSFAPAVDEQPFDRFFKKPAVDNQTAAIHASSLPPDTEKKQSFPVVDTRAGNQSNTVYVNLPAAKKPVAEKEKSRPLQDIEKRDASRESINPPPAGPRETASRTFSSSLPVMATDESVLLEEKFSQPLDDIKKQYVEKVLNQQRKRRAGGQFAKPVVLGIGVVALLAAGMLIGLSINKRGNGNAQKDLSHDLAISDQPTDDRTRTIPISSSGRPTDKHADNSVISQSEQVMDETRSKQEAAEKKKSRIQKQKLVADSAQHITKATSNVPDSEAMAVQREAARRADALLARDAVKNNITNYVFLSASKYNVGTFGGISDVQITVSNRSLYSLDLVVVEVEYIQSNKKIFKTENLYFHNIGAGSALMEEAPKSSRGVKIQYRIAIINSKELGLSYTGL